MAMVICGCIVIGLLAVLGGWMGSHHHVGFTVVSRSSWGMIGAFWPVLNRVLTGCVFMGIQIYWGGLATRIVLNAIIGPKLIFMENTLPVSANVTTPNLICFFVFVLVMTPLLMIPPEKLQVPFRIASFMITTVLLGMLIWSLAAARGAGPLLSTGSTQSGSVLSWNMLYGLQSFIGGWSGGVLGQSDWTRYSRRSHSALFGQGFAAPLTVCLTALFGILITSAASKMYGQLFWNPFLLLLYIQNTPTASARAGTFFAGLGLLASQFSLCIVLNSVSAGMDLTTLFPKYINIRRGACIVTIIGIAIVPWNYVNQASTFIVVLSGWSVFLSPMTGILLADYFLVRRRQLRLTDLYVGNRTSVYWYTCGINWRAVVAWAMGLWPLLPGFVRAVKMTSDYTSWDNVYDINYFLGFIIAFVVHLGLHTVFPAAGQRGEGRFDFGEKGSLATDM
jgi:NCS1 family nucleobase:cation symporter-1